MKTHKYYLELVEEIRSLVDAINFGTSLVIVEGQNDEAALREFGLKTPVLKFRGTGHSETLFIDEVAQDYRGRSVAVILDFDEEGMRMADRISRELEERGVKIQHYFRRAFKEILLKEGVRHVEEIRAIKHKSLF
ncbi:MAG: toprim domain-containing protein [Candidatus Verstraetearchaeota archaeon]|jgi:5S rRNA maturation endonuclease (ribonuclease M5)|nr:toprim domain-containing protein [Candidatus Verstraetearchaeota archaeon]